MRFPLILTLTVTSLLSACATQLPSPQPVEPKPAQPPVVAPTAPVEVTPPPAPTAPTPTTPPASNLPTPPINEAGTASYKRTTFYAMPGWPGDHLEASWQAWLTSCQRIKFRADWAALCNDALAMQNPDDRAIRQFFEQRFTPWQIQTKEGADSGLVTGYYEALLTGSREYRPGRVPLHAAPDDLLTIDIAATYPEVKGMRVRGRVEGKKVLPYWTRAEIDAGRVNLNDKVLAWADNAIDAFFLQVQGSGRVQLEDGSMLRLGYADQNGHPYRSIGRWLADKGELSIDQVSMQKIKAWAAANPQRLSELLNANPSYVFFRELPSNNAGPIGALNVPLTDGASIAIDPKFTPLGTPVYLSTTRPYSSEPLQRLVHAQDTGGAIRGAIRADFFWGFGHEAGELAGKMKQQGQMWILWPRGLTPK